MNVGKTEPNVQTPTAQEVATLLGTLFGVQVEARNETRKTPVEKGTLAVYGTDDGSARVLFHLDAALAASTAAALTRIPASVAEEMTRLNQLSENMLENLREVTNVLSRLPRTRWGQLRIQTTTPLPATLAAPITQTLKDPKPLARFAVTVPGYRPGVMTLLEVGSAAGDPSKGGK